MQMRALGNSGLQVTALGLGCMGMSEFYGPSDDAESLKTLDRAFELGVTFYDTADMYGTGHNERLLSRFLTGKRGDVVLATKFGIVRTADDAAPGQYKRIVDTSAKHVREACEASLKRLGVEVIDLYYAHRINPEVPIEETLGAMAELVRQGKVRALGLSEVSAATLRRAHAVHPIAAVQSEYSLWSRDPEGAVLPACRELGTTFVAYSPLGRGLLTGAIGKDTRLDPTDFRLMNPRFQGANLDDNLKRVEAVKALAKAKGATPAQVALAWLLAQGTDILPIPGTRRIKYLEENVGSMSVHLSASELAGLDAIGQAAGERYPEAGMKLVNV